MRDDDLLVGLAIFGALTLALVVCAISAVLFLSGFNFLIGGCV